MKYKVGDKIIFNQDCRLAFSYIPKGKTGEITDIVDTGLTIAYRIKMKDYPNATVPTDKVDEACTKIKPKNDKHNILNGLLNSDGSIDGEKLMEKLESQNKKDAIHPDYYKFHGYDVFDMANYFGLSFPLGNGLKYLLRAGTKDKDKTIQDLEKCVECVQREIKFLKQQAK